MTSEERTKFIKELIENVKKDILKESIKYPEAWDGIELRWRIADVFNQVVFGDIGKHKGKQYLDYKNFVYTTDLI